jgi:hypothetical protein
MGRGPLPPHRKRRGGGAQQRRYGIVAIILMSKDFSKLWELRRLVQEFEKLDKNLITALDIENFTEIYDKVIELKTQIQQIISNGLEDAIDAGLANKLKQIRDNFGYNIDKMLPDETWREIQKEIAGEKMWEQYLEKGGEEDVDYYHLQRINEIGTIICSTTLKQNIIKNLEKIKACYANGLFDAAIIYCRVLIEYVTFELRKRKGFIPKNASDFGSYKLTASLNQIERFINPKIFKQIKDVTDLAGNILHSKYGANINSNTLTPFDAIRWTFVFVEEVHNVK